MSHSTEEQATRRIVSPHNHMDNLIARIRMATTVVGYCDDARTAIHQTIVESNKDVSEGDFFLAWHAAVILDKECT